MLNRTTVGSTRASATRKQMAGSSLAMTTKLLTQGEKDIHYSRFTAVIWPPDMAMRVMTVETGSSVTCM
jgi:hypothetical protein